MPGTPHSRTARRPDRRPQRARRAGTKRPRRRPIDHLLDLFSEPRTAWALIIALSLLAAAGPLAAWTRDHRLAPVGRVADETRLVRVEFQAENTARTQQDRDRARQEAPRVLTASPLALASIEEDLRVLPRRLAPPLTPDPTPTPTTTTSPTTDAPPAPQDQPPAQPPAQPPPLDRALRDLYNLDDARAAALRDIASSPARLAEWDAAVERLADVLNLNPLVDAADAARAARGIDRRVELVIAQAAASPKRERVQRAQLIDLSSPEAKDALQTLARVAGFLALGQPAADVVAERLRRAEPTFRYDAAATLALEDAAASSVQPVVDRRAVGQIILARGDLITPQQVETLALELRAFAEKAGFWPVWIPRLAAVAAVAALLALLGFALASSAPPILREPPALATLAGVLLTTQALSASVALLEPRFAYVAALLAVLLAVSLLTIVCGRAAALPASAAVAALTAVTIDLTPGQFGSILLPAAASSLALGTVRSRRAVAVSGFTASALAALCTPTLALLGRPALGLALQQALGDALLAAVCGIVAQSVTLFALPFIERAFGVTTGLKLIELRDPKQPLLRELQRRAPGTYNHSLNVASIAEAAADAVGADTLLTYVGALYHDIGKINKPEYFVENQSGGPNRHEQLSPAMSLLIIVGHVKDGAEIAREYGLPRNLLHFIEAHHGTTLVEYFFHRAVKLAIDTDHPSQHDDDRGPDELDYRYPGPKPRSREVAILMLADAVESATRSLAEPTPSRIATLVRDLASKRLADGQFDDCDLTFRELEIISDSITKTVASIHHGRVQYPSDKERKKPSPPPAPTPAGA